MSMAELQKQTILIQPETIDGIKVGGFGYTQHHGFGYRQIGWMWNDNLTKYYFPKNPNDTKVNGNICSFNNAYSVYWDTESERVYESYILDKGKIFGYNYYKAFVGSALHTYIANVSYMYNYENAPNDGWYWVDSYDESTITFIPPEPTREGYNFDGWYKEAEYVNEWDFTTDITGKKINADGYQVIKDYTGIYLYAKWTEQ